MCVCNRCVAICTWSFLALGVLFLLRDLGVWNFWNIQWWTALLLLIGVGSLGWGHCKDCQALHGPKRKK